jgi:heterodisulfide reductase subunit A
MTHLGAAADGPADSRASRIGVFVCHCGGNISDVVDVERVAAEAARMPGRIRGSSLRLLGPSQASSGEDPRRARPRGIGGLLADPARRLSAGHRSRQPQQISSSVNVGSRCRGWSLDRRATQASRLVRAWPRLTSSRSTSGASIQPSALVIGGGVAGLVAARDLAGAE